MGRVVDRWNAMSSRFARLLPPRCRFSEGAQPASRILAIVPQGPIRLLVQAISRDAGWTLTLSDSSPGLHIGQRTDLPPIIIYDREVSPQNWREAVGALARQSPRPYVICCPQTPTRTSGTNSSVPEVPTLCARPSLATICSAPSKGHGCFGRASSRSARRCTDHDPFHEMTPLRTAYRMSSGTLWRFSLFKMLLRCVSTVYRLKFSMLATSLLLFPSAMSCSSSRSRSVSKS